MALIPHWLLHGSLSSSTKPHLGKMIFLLGIPVSKYNEKNCWFEEQVESLRLLVQSALFACSFNWRIWKYVRPFSDTVSLFLQLCFDSLTWQVFFCIDVFLNFWPEDVFDQTLFPQTKKKWNMQTCWTVFADTPPWKADLSDQVPWKMFLQNWREQVMGNSCLRWRICLTKRIEKHFILTLFAAPRAAAEASTPWYIKNLEPPMAKFYLTFEVATKFFQGYYPKDLDESQPKNSKVKTHSPTSRTFGQQSRLSHRSWTSCGTNTRREGRSCYLLPKVEIVFYCKICFCESFFFTEWIVDMVGGSILWWSSSWVSHILPNLGCQEWAHQVSDRWRFGKRVLGPWP